ncbi:16S rRNA (cytosine(1402)-N(4))-methyltransferase [candidate division WOR-1 bacterium RIFOXYA12_FULL_43_27]|uniref:Ribosomal RNA small subunit methyltransferase H n=1 Tax=candidate division WOR-1 bacterium RIFOXYC2_FULL_46_14 TaxID=1802587 RepID=A0A1F4U4L8_UNCSA|nr:MAG: 16S rRNA (cytosine(1402)-N(4))-methyltransferase [candidate division WOR-1 bacterium RIFOXYA12_FULL_43_27]OGC20851.1 MAG: 16S rRNA (cytosine(1402)-N(4))-methyltransferase [candidate division WOR-1 bacterium RIFOXYB2_FULL_46_45]OGC31411.1 MAG: 16S rRNA (cytosine(1402)-N(4))-methyltransferase [candidate division WOR-1 bacterium RIFOXYA2_FULL_46_56]OGC39817.1 MAG: 16S rRNA (cytosine(1402)-N(4))-methyltransferase [candidate division WOR-1 bacterium RIFOXYC2_FULL_46_14]
MSQLKQQHIPVLSNKVVEFLNPQTGKTYLDCTYGFGGHATKLKVQSAKCKVIGIDRDRDIGTSEDQIIRGNFGDLKDLVKEKVDGILFDLGVSSYQIDEPSRGFSIRFDAPLDMRMDKSQKLTAYDLIVKSDEEELGRIFKEYGEERFSKRIARKVKEKLPKTTFELKEIVEKAIPGWKKRESVARIFQALRIAVNDELENLKKGLAAAVPLLNPGGRIVVISYHSLEDRIVKWFFKEQEKDGILKILTKKPVRAEEEEQKENPRSRPAKLRAAEKL